MRIKFFGKVGRKNKEDLTKEQLNEELKKLKVEYKEINETLQELRKQ